MTTDAFDVPIPTSVGFERLFGAAIYPTGDDATVVPMLDVAPPGQEVDDV